MAEGLRQRIARDLPAVDLPEFGLRLHLAHPRAGLARLTGGPPYWAHVWAGGAVLALHLRSEPGLVRGLRVLDFGAGSGIVGIAASLAGARAVRFCDSDPAARAALALNALANGQRASLWRGGAVDVVLAGDVFYAPEVTAAVLPRLRALARGGARVLVGDPGRRDLPDGLKLVAQHEVRDMGDAPGVRRLAGVHELLPGA